MLQDKGLDKFSTQGFALQQQELHHSYGWVGSVCQHLQTDNRETQRILQDFEARRVVKWRGPLF